MSANLINQHNHKCRLFNNIYNEISISYLVEIRNKRQYLAQQYENIVIWLLWVANLSFILKIPFGIFKF